LIEKRQLTELLDIKIQSVKQYQPRQSGDVIVNRVFDPIPSNPKVYILCKYINATSKIQVVRITNIANWYFERVVFPGQRLVFEAMPNAQLEVHTGMMASAILVDTIPCDQLRVESELEDNLNVSEEIERFVDPDTLTVDRAWGWMFNR